MNREVHGNVEEMSEFFDKRAEGYDLHMENVLGADFRPFYEAVAIPVTPTNEKISILDLGCGTGLELEGIFAKAPNAHIACVDLSTNMLNRLKGRYSGRLDQLSIMQESYLTVHLPKDEFDYVVSVQTMHHLIHDVKRNLYERIKNALKTGGKYIEGDYIASLEEEERYLAEYATKMIGHSGEQSYHIDIPFSLGTQRRLLLEAGFREIDVIFNRGRAAVYVCTKI